MPMVQNCAILSSFDCPDNIREDLLDIITNISPRSTPFFSTLRKTAATNIRHEWLVDELAQGGDPDTEGEAAVHCTGESTDADFVDKVCRCRLDNITHIFRQTGDISWTQRAVNTAGVPDEYPYQVEKSMRELAILIEYAIIWSRRGALQVAPQEEGVCASPAGCRQMDGLRATAEWDHHDFDCLTEPMSGTILDFGGSPCEDLTPVVLGYLAQLMVEKGAMPKNIWVNAILKRLISSFYLNGRTSNIEQSEKKLIHAIDIYDGDFGLQRINYHRMLAGRTAGFPGELLMTDDEYLALAILRAVKLTELALMGNMDKYMIEGELTFEARSPAALGWIRGLCTDNVLYCSPCDTSVGNTGGVGGSGGVVS